ncbi:Necrosis inducing protein [Phytophthora cactorum]|nr:Necrosis inducing protein [Phytophthora cactorum]
MKISTLIGVVAVFLAAAEAKETKETKDSTPAQTPLATMPEAQLDPTIQDTIQEAATPSPEKDAASKEPTIAYDKVEPFEMAQPSDATITEKAAIKFRPKLHVVNGCHPYPAVNTAGQISKGLKKADATGAACSGSELGTQIYGRSAWFGRVWAIMYAWYFPDVTPDWEHVIVWTNNPNVTNQVILAVTTSNSTGGYSSQIPPDASMLSGKSVKISYNNNALESTTKEGGTQNLVLWHQLTPEAQEALNDDQSFGGVQWRPARRGCTAPGGLLAPVPKPITPPAGATPIRPQPQPLAPNPAPAVPAATPAKQSPGSGQQMFQQMFALLKQMLPVEQYATLHSEMRKGNGNDIKSIVDIIKRIAGDAIFSSVIQKMDLTRTFPTNNTPGAFSAVKPEPGVPTTSPGAIGRPIAARSTVTTASPKVTAIAPNTRPIAAAPPTLAAAPVAMPASIAAQITRPMSIQPSTGTVSTPPAKAGVKPEPAATTTTTTSPPSAVAQSRNEALEKIMFAKRLLSHAATCSLGHGVCQVKKCDDVRRVFKHSLSLGITDHCSIPFCDGLRRTYAQNQATLAAKAKAAQAAGVRRGAGSDDDDDNTPLSSAVNKAKKQAKTKSPKSAPLKRKMSNASLTRTNSSSPGPSSAVSTPTITLAASTASAAKPQQKNVTANMTQEYGRLLQLILHVEKCTTAACPVGEECVESKAIMKQMSTPNPPIGLLPILPVSIAASPAPSPSPPPVKPFVPIVNTTAPAVTSSPSGALKRNSTAVSTTPRSPLKKPRTNSTSRGKATAAEVAALSAAASELVSQELAQASVADIRKEADVLTHTNIELGTERRIMMEGGVRRVRMAEQLPCQKEEWVEKDLFNSEKLRTQMGEVGRRSGVHLGGQTSEVMSYALHVYLKQVIEEMVEVSKQRGDSQAQSLDALQKAQRVGMMINDQPGAHMELTATDILRVSCEDSFTSLRQEDLARRSQLLEDAKREEQIERERAKKRKKVDRSKLNQDERDEAEMDIEELAVKDLKERLLQQDKSGVVKVDVVLTRAFQRVRRAIQLIVTLSPSSSNVSIDQKPAMVCKNDRLSHWTSPQNTLPL